MKFTSIQYLRAFAAFAVIYIHLTFSFFNRNFCGSIGVDIFFILSGFIMANSMQKSKKTPKEFFIKRIKRIYPLYFLMTSVFILVLLFFGGNYLVLINNFFYSNLFIPFSNKGIYTDPILFVGWSLNIEILFYNYIFNVN